MSRSAGLPAAICAVLFAAGAARATDGAGHTLSRCLAIPESRYQTGLLFNPEGMQTYYDRARCLQELAVERREAALCARVVERRSWLLDGSEISPAACRRRVGAQQRRDGEAAGQLQPPQRVRQVSVERDNNGRDFAVRLQTTGGDGTNLRLTLSIVDAAGRERVLRAAMQPMGERPEELVLFLPASQLASASGMPAERSLRLRVVLERLLIGPEDRAVHSHAPALALRSSAETTFVPASLQRVVRAP